MKMSSFADLGIRPPLVQLAEEEEIETPTALQAGVIPVLRRGGNLVARASSGSGKTLAYSLALLDRLAGAEAPAEADSEPGTRALVLVPTDELAGQRALGLVPLAQAAGLAAGALTPGWAADAGGADVLVAAPETALAAVRASALKLTGLEVLVIDGASLIHGLGGWQAVDTLLDHVPKEAQRVVFTARITDQIEDLIERRVKKAHRYPAEAAIGSGSTPTAGEAGYVLVPERDKIEILARLLASPRQQSAPPAIFFRNDERGALAAESLALRGFVIGELEDDDAHAVVTAGGAARADLIESSGEEPDRSISYDVPADAEQLLARHGGDVRALVMVEPRQLPHLHEIAGLAGISLRPVPVVSEEPGSRLQPFRDQVRQALAEEDLAAQMLVLEPLLDEFDAIEVAAALAALLRSNRPAAAQQPAAARASQPLANAAAAPAAPVSDPGPAPATWARLYVGVGERDGTRPGDLVGAIAGEADIPGSQVGKIDIRDTFSIVEVQAKVAEKVIRAVNGTTIKGRSARVDYDRGGDRTRKTMRTPRRRTNDRPDARPRRPAPGGSGPSD